MMIAMPKRKIPIPILLFMCHPPPQLAGKAYQRNIPQKNPPVSFQKIISVASFTRFFKGPVL
jgi:hypothetical protein